MSQRVVFVIGSPFSGSTFLTHLLAEGKELPTIGEAQRFRSFSQFQHVPDHYLDGCSLCSTHATYDCPVWTQFLIDNAAGADIKLYEQVLKNCQSDVVVDSSKEVDWLSYLIRKNSDISPAAIIVSRSPFNFIDSNRKRLPQFDQVWHAEGWRNIYIHSFRTLAQLSIPFVHIRYDRFVNNHDFLYRVVDRLLGPIEVSRKQGGGKRSRLVHPLGGNLSEISRRPEFNREIFAEQATNFTPSEISFDVSRVLDGSASNRSLQNSDLISDKWDFGSAVNILSVPGIIDICHYLGYTLDDFLIKFRT